MSSILLFLLAGVSMKPSSNWVFQKKQIDKMIQERGDKRISATEHKQLVNSFMFYGNLWNVNPVLAACVGWKESNFRKWIRVGEAKEIGIMQIIPREGTTRKGYKLCTGRSKPTWRQLRKIETNICIGIYELNRKRWRVNRYINWYRKRNRLRYCKWYNSRYWSWRHRRLFKKHPHLKKYFWVAAYNWGPGRVFTHSKSKWDPVGYPIRVLRCFHEYGGFPEVKRIEIASTTVRFVSGKFELGRVQQTDLGRSLKRLAEMLSSDPSLKMSITGYTDSIGAWSYNKKLSRKRAKKVYDLMLSYGANPKQLSYKGLGEARPVATNKTKKGRSLNRRVEIKIYREQIIRKG